MATDKTFSFALSSSGLVKFADSGLDFAGTVSRATPGAATVITASAQLAGPVTLASGVVLEAAALAWDGSTFTGSGTLGVTTNGGRLAISTGVQLHRRQRLVGDVVGHRRRDLDAGLRHRHHRTRR